MNTPEEFVRILNLQPHPEGGFFSQTYKAEEEISAQALPERFGGARRFSTAIYYLLRSGEYSAFHRIKSDEIWHFYYGSPLNIYVIDQQGRLEIIRLGGNMSNGERFQAVVGYSNWFAAEPVNNNSFSLVGCTVAPGFDFEDFEIADKNEMISLFLQHKELLLRLCR